MRRPVHSQSNITAPGTWLSDVNASVRRSVLFPVVGLCAVLAYLVYAWIAFDVNGLIAKARPDRALILGTDSVAYKVHVTRRLRRGDLEVAVEGERTATYKTPPDWVKTIGEIGARVDLGGGYGGIAVDGRPADCIKLALSELWPDRFGAGAAPDLVV
ncbi:MAG: hypothetical protein AAFQ35_14090, partial [Pseudomonadota bacterium]